VIERLAADNKTVETMMRRLRDYGERELHRI